MEKTATIKLTAMEISVLQLGLRQLIDEMPGTKENEEPMRFLNEINSRLVKAHRETEESK